MTIFICESYQHFYDWCIEHRQNPHDKDFAVFAYDYRQPGNGRMKRDGDRIIILGAPSTQYLATVASAVIPCGFDTAENQYGQTFELRDFLRMQEAVEATDSLVLAQQRLARAQDEVRKAQAQLSAAQMAVGPIETLARELWVQLEVKKDGEADKDSWELYEELRDNIEERDRSWQTLLIDEERNEWRALAHRVFELAEAQRQQENLDLAQAALDAADEEFKKDER